MSSYGTGKVKMKAWKTWILAVSAIIALTFPSATASAEMLCYTHESAVIAGTSLRLLLAHQASDTKAATVALEGVDQLVTQDITYTSDIAPEYRLPDDHRVPEDGSYVVHVIEFRAIEPVQRLESCFDSVGSPYPIYGPVSTGYDPDFEPEVPDLPTTGPAIAGYWQAAAAAGLALALGGLLALWTGRTRRTRA